ncbi:MAG TPA: hypothetical protein VGV14_10045 [Rhodanobacter sp.]|nr:hypothetical protein [Rhodanobacter sp.]
MALISHLRSHVPPGLISRFEPGRIVMTRGIHDLSERGLLTWPYLVRHLGGDWGDLDAHDRRVNNTALESGGRLLSSYQVTPDLTLWIITEADRGVTTLLLPSEY